MKRAWYLGLSAGTVGDRVILIGDPDRVGRISELLVDPVRHPVSRGLKSVTGFYDGQKVTVAAYGMGAPIAAIVLHEFADLGVTKFLRIGTAMFFPPASPGEFLISETAIGFDGTSLAYGRDAVDAGEFRADSGLVATLREATLKFDRRPRLGRYATYDAFYRDMFGIDPEGKTRVDANRKMLAERNVLAVDMETSALLAAAAALRVSCATLCLGTVNALTQEKLASDLLAAREQRLFRTALKGLTAFDPIEPRHE